MELQFHTLDVFTSTRLEGNPLAVVSVPAALKGKLSQETMAKIAQEFHLSETVFLHEGEGEGDDASTSTERHINIFTVEGEIPFAGHPTIGTSVLVKYHLALPSVDTLVAKCGPIGIEAGPGQYIRARIPHDVRVHGRTLADVVRGSDHPGLSADPVVREAELKAPVVSIVNGMTFVLVKLPSLGALGALEKERLDFAKLDTPLLDEGWRESFVGRYYYVDVGDGGGDDGGEKKRRLRTRLVEVGFEDPATGSAASALCSFLTLVEEKRGARFEITQGVEMGRRSVIHVETTVKQGQGEDGLILDDVYLGGTAVVVMKGSLKVDNL
ncbi:hypothetical protein SLS62_001208 [Diatrype stigma]|uniref:Phenazine biosynthesis protein n=1 Tax=Diatrype stigma TaxID=117547 RepID=A0AAN9UWH6_9PEZI